ncbi:MAG TPA: hypothetical protein VI636_14875 [Candidatus Angelobacter sp.]
MNATTTTKRQYSLGIWALGLGYFIFYTPYSGLIKAVTAGLLSNKEGVSGFVLLPSTLVATALAMPLFITVMRWWKFARVRKIARFTVPAPSWQTMLSGVCFATIIATTTLAYSFKGVSIVFALLLMRGGILIMAPLIDWAFRRRVRWFSWTGLVLSLIALLIAFLDVHQYQLSLLAVLNLVAYLTGYALRLPCMTQMAKTGNQELSLCYFVEEQMVAMPTLVLVPALLALFGHGAIAGDLRSGFAHLFNGSFVLYGLAIGFFYAGLGIFCTFIFLDRRENTFCVPMHSGSSLLAGIVASYALFWWLHGPHPSGVQIGGIVLIMAALLIMSPLHHLPLYVKQIKAAIAGKELVLLDFIGNKQINAQSTPRFITVNFQAVRNVLRNNRKQQL